ncbi:hypothetical protein O181_088289 [Austropuccinia psidii MF-1]|uniref:Uncharacterized protein n=1 Tax=Austropuccinia psidii MF-1 TaxID=1389203 RepID=A0A9Q3IRE7_9BASI|nr:hypothetical protein [Austropuccinia psidii MF-1]
MIYHYAPCVLSNPIITLSRLNSVTSVTVTSPSVYFKGKTHLTQAYNALWNPQDHSRIPITWPSRCWIFHFNSIAPREYWPRISQRLSKEVADIQISFQGIKHSLDTSIGPYRLYSDNLYGICSFWANSYSTVVIQGTQFIFQFGQIYIDPKKVNKAGGQPSRIKLQLFTYTGHLFTPGDLFPS